MTDTPSNNVEVPELRQLIDALNDAWGTAFWSQRYSAWEQILPPRLAASHPNPTQQLDFKRFSSDALKDHLRAERILQHTLAHWAIPVAHVEAFLDHELLDKLPHERK